MKVSPSWTRVYANKRVMTTAVQLVVKKFEDPVGGDVNYPAFIQAIDVEYTGQTKEADKIHE